MNFAKFLGTPFTEHLWATASEFFYNKNIMFAREKETVSDKPRKNMLHDKTIPPYLKVVRGPKG